MGYLITKPLIEKKNLKKKVYILFKLKRLEIDLRRYINNIYYRYSFTYLN